MPPHIADDVATWTWDVRTDRVVADRHMARLFGVSDADARGGPLAAYVGVIHPDDREPTAALIRKALATGEPYEAAYRVRGADGQYREVLARGEVEYSADGTPARLPGVVVDLTRRHQTEIARRAADEQYRTLFESIDQGFCVVEVLFDGDRAVDCRLLEANSAFERHTGLPAAPGRTLKELVPGFTEDGFAPAGRVARTGRPERYVHRVQQLGGRWIEGYAFPHAGRVAVLFNDITDRKRAEEELFASRETLRAVLDGIPQRVFWKAADLTYLGCNQPLAEDMGFRSPAEVVGKNDYQATWASVADTFRADDRRVIDTGVPKLDYEEVTVTADGQRSLLRTSKQPLRGPDGRVVGVLGTYEDITDRKRAQDVIAASEARQAYLLHLSDALRPLTDPAAVRDVACRTLGEALRADRACYCVVNEAAGRIRFESNFVRPGVNSLTGEYPLGIFGWVGRAFRVGRPVAVADVSADPIIPAADRPALASLGIGAFLAAPLVKGEQVVALVSVSQMTPRAWTAAEAELVWESAERTWAAGEQARADAAVRASEARLRTLVEVLPDAVLINAGDRVTFCNPSCLRLFGATDPAQLVGRKPLDLVAPAYRDRVRGRLDAMRAGGRPVPEQEEEMLRLDGTAVPVLATAMPISDGGSDAVFVVLRDLTERKRVEGRLREQDALLREAAEVAHVGGWGFDPATGRSDWTDETFRIHNLDPAAGAEEVEQGLRRYPGDDGRRVDAAVRAAVAHGTPYDIESDFTAADGAKKRVRTICRPVVEGGRVVRVRGSLQDVTDRYRLEQQYRQSQKMEAFGQLAGGVAHDFNNMLTVINGYTALLLDQVPAGDPTWPLLDEVRKAGERSAALTRQLLAFSRQQVLAPRVLDLNAVVDDVAGLLRRLIGEDVRLETSLAAGLWPVSADSGQVEQVLVNLCVNARDAMPTGGRLTVGTRNAVVKTADAAGHPDARPGPHAVLAVADTGTGMTPEVMARIFEPFFTTKGVGQGTGLGLATVFGIVKQAGGHVRVRSAVGAGSTFEVYLPRVSKDAGEAPAGGSDVRAPAGGRETVLVVEDEAGVRKIVRLTLVRCGYNVLEAVDGEDAAAKAAAYPGPIHLLLTDVVMPGSGGRTAAERVTAARPAMRVLYVSGHTDDALLRHGVAAADADFLQKPFTPTGLATKVRQILDRPATVPGGR